MDEKKTIRTDEVFDGFDDYVDDPEWIKDDIEDLHARDKKNWEMFKIRNEYNKARIALMKLGVIGERALKQLDTDMLSCMGVMGAQEGRRMGKSLRAACIKLGAVTGQAVIAVEDMVVAIGRGSEPDPIGEIIQEMIMFNPMEAIKVSKRITCYENDKHIAKLSAVPVLPLKVRLNTQKGAFHRKCYMQLKTFRNIRRSAA